MAELRTTPPRGARSLAAARPAVQPQLGEVRRGEGGGTHLSRSGAGGSSVLGPPSPCILALFPQQTCPPLSCQAKYFGLAGGAERTERSRQTNPFGVGRGGGSWARPLRATQGDTAAAQPAGAGEPSAPGGIRGDCPRRVPRSPGPPPAPRASAPPSGLTGLLRCLLLRTLCDFLSLEASLSLFPLLSASLSSSLCLCFHAESLAPAACHRLCLCGSHDFFSVSCHLCVGFFVTLPLPFPFPLKLASLCPFGPVRSFSSPEPSGEEPGLGTRQD